MKLRLLCVPVHLVFLTETHVVILAESVEVAGELCSRNHPEIHTTTFKMQMMSDLSPETEKVLLWLFTQLFGATAEQRAPAVVKNKRCEPTGGSVGHNQNQPDDAGPPVVHEDSDANQEAEEQHSSHRAHNDS